MESISKRKQKRIQKKKQLHINQQLKKKLFPLSFIAPCYYCKYVFMFSQLTVEHIIPLSFGGTNEPNNIALACAPCNHQKGKEAYFEKRNLM